MQLYYITTYLIAYYSKMVDELNIVCDTDNELIIAKGYLGWLYLIKSNAKHVMLTDWKYILRIISI